MMHENFLLLKFIECDALEEHMKHGWKLLEIHHTNKMDKSDCSQEQVRHEISINGISNNSGYYDKHKEICNVQYPIQIHSILCLIGLDEKSVIAEYTNKEISYNEKIDILTKSHKEIEKKTEEMQKSINSKEFDLKKVYKDWDEEIKQSQVFRDRVKTMETDLAKLRNALGDIKFKEITQSS